MKKCLCCILAVALLLSLCVAPVGAKEANSYDPAVKQPVVAVLINGENWYAADLSDYKGQADVWVPVPIDYTKLKANQENYFSFRTNVDNGAAFSDTSVDLYMTTDEHGYSSFLCSQAWCGDGFTAYNDRRLNVKLQIYRNGVWETVSDNGEYRTDASQVLGEAEDGSWSNTARNIVVDDMSNVT